eukprot:14660129-Alexandrium_andersonii.AAC.1
MCIRDRARLHRLVPALGPVRSRPSSGPLGRAPRAPGGSAGSARGSGRPTLGLRAATPPLAPWGSAARSAPAASE